MQRGGRLVQFRVISRKLKTQSQKNKSLCKVVQRQINPKLQGSTEENTKRLDKKDKDEVATERGNTH